MNYTMDGFDDDFGVNISYPSYISNNVTSKRNFTLSIVGKNITLSVEEHEKMYYVMLASNIEMHGLKYWEILKPKSIFIIDDLFIKTVDENIKSFIRDTKIDTILE